MLVLQHNKYVHLCQQNCKKKVYGVKFSHQWIQFFRQPYTRQMKKFWSEDSFVLFLLIRQYFLQYNIDLH